MKNIFFLLAAMTFFGCSSSPASPENISSSKPSLPVQQKTEKPEKDWSHEELIARDDLAKATFAGGCFWCMEGPFEAQEGVVESISGYAGGEEENPTYKEVSTGKTTHREAVQVFYNPQEVSYETLLQIYWKQIDPFDAGGQFADRGEHYTTAVFFHTEEQKILAEISKKKLQESDTENFVATLILPFLNFYPAEADHQDFYKHAAERYKKYKKGSGRAGYIEKNSEKVEEVLEEKKEEYNYTPEEIEELRKNLDPLSWHVVAGNGTEKPFDNKYWNNKDEGIYVDTVTGEPLFSSTHKYDSGTGWPTFYKSIQEDVVSYHSDTSLGMDRTEIRSEKGDSHLGHVFDDGPEEQGGKRFCVNSASLLFIPKEEIEEKGYEEFLELFENEEK